MKYVENIQQVAELQPDYLGFIFYDKSKRNFDGIIPKLPESIKKTGVFVNATTDVVLEKVSTYNLKAVQLHGDESADFCRELKCHFEQSEKSQQEKLNEVEVIKVFGIKDEFNFENLHSYLDVVDYFLFDTKGKERGGNGITFNWKVLEKYPFSKPFFLSGGIGLAQLEEIKQIRKTDLPIYALDVNSQFEIEAGLKSVENIKEFKGLLVES